ncbi:MAG TPA: acyl-ACP--UDP-N-acetylglucosamine O-acyltransferase [Candidatus Acidoferrum sp.]|nr:acyl-ACP--UDP-N-acetylglucosamine O-acyltransferase [Candidatus Acidoferrum sp.]
MNNPIIDPSAKIGANVKIGPWTIIGPGVEIGDDCEIASHVIIKGPARIGSGNRIFQFASVGEDPSDKKFHGEPTWLEIGDNNVIREGATIHRGTEVGGGITKIGSDNLFMPYTHVAHDCIIGNNVIFSNNAAVSGHVVVEDWAILGGYAGVYQFLRIGAHSFIGAQTHVNMDVPAYIMVNGNPPEAKGINTTGLERRGFSKESIQLLRKAFKILYRHGNTLEEALNELETLAPEAPEVGVLIASVRASTKGILR